MQQNWTSQQHTHDKRYERIVSYSSMRLRMKETYSVKSYLSSQEVDELRFHYYSWCYFVTPCPKVTCWSKSHWCHCMLFVKYCDLLRYIISLYLHRLQVYFFTKSSLRKLCHNTLPIQYRKKLFVRPPPPPTHKKQNNNVLVDTCYLSKVTLAIRCLATCLILP